MRTQLLAYLTTNLTGSIKTSQELPWTEGGQRLDLKNMRRVYLDEPDKEQTQLLGMIGEDDISQNITRVRGYLTVDAKARNSDLDAALTTLAQAKSVNTITDSFRKEFDYTTTVDADRITFEFEYRFHTLA
jgi:hypothetical protein